ncbi:MAG: extracellular solute-binding protein [Lachnospiraceae bacterium]|nr:extracellular solute-binding protein [Lachnospiraceae bacterium]
MKKRAFFLSMIFSVLIAGCSSSGDSADEGVVLRVCNWEEYIDLGDWDEEETINLESGDIIGENALYEDFEEWYYETYGEHVKVEYSCFGTNEELYNMLTLGDEFDLVCPSDYMFMKLMTEDKLTAFSDGFFDEDIPENYYVRNVSPFIREKFDDHEIGGERWSEYAAAYMWGVTGFLYDPEKVDAEKMNSWNALCDQELKRQITIKDNVRDAYFPALAGFKRDRLTDPAFIADPDYAALLEREMNDNSEETVDAALGWLQAAKDNAYSFETDSGKADIVSGKVLANVQWSGDAVYAMDQAEEDGFLLAYSVPEECTNLWFDGWVMLKDGVGADEKKQKAAEAFVNFISRPDNAVRNMYYIGYTSSISGGTDGDAVFEYAEWTYGAEDDEEEPEEYDLSWFFDRGEDEEYMIETSEDQITRQLFAQYPTPEVMERSSIMCYFDDEANARINHMWINVRCFNLQRVPMFWRMVIALAILGAVAAFSAYRLHKKRIRR